MHTVLYLALLATIVIAVRCAELNALCDKEEDCTSTESYCKKESPCTKGICLCKRNFKAKDSKTCIKDALIGDACASTEECPSGYQSSAATCSGGSCKCQSGYEAYTKAPSTNKGCERIGEKLDAACDSSADKYCGNGAYCDASKCKCSTGYKKDDDYNCRKSKFKEACTATGDCETYRAECKSSVCDCKESADKHHEQDRMSACLPASAQLYLGLGDKCDHRDIDNLKYCGTGLTCSSCPEDMTATDPTQYCLEGCSGLQASIALLLLLLVGYFTL